MGQKNGYQTKQTAHSVSTAILAIFLTRPAVHSLSWPKKTPKVADAEGAW